MCLQSIGLKDFICQSWAVADLFENSTSISRNEKTKKERSENQTWERENFGPKQSIVNKEAYKKRLRKGRKDSKKKMVWVWRWEKRDIMYYNVLLVFLRSFVSDFHSSFQLLN